MTEGQLRRKNNHLSSDHFKSALDVSDLDNIKVTTGDILDHVTCDQLHDESYRILVTNANSSSNDSKTIIPGFKITSPNPKSNLTTQDIDRLYKYYCTESRRKEPGANFKKKRRIESHSPAMVAPGSDIFVTNRGEELSPAVW